MSRQNVELARRGLDAFNERDADAFARLVEAPVGLLFELRGGKASRTRGYLDHREALREAGLSD